MTIPMSFNEPRADSPILEVSGISKRFGGAQALNGVGLRLFSGEVVALIGENGAGKSTLMKILGGIVTPDEGEIRVHGKDVRLSSPSAAMGLGISLIHQELNLADNLSVEANLFLGREMTWGGVFGLANTKAMEKKSRELLSRVGLRVSPSERLGNLTPGQKQLVEIARSLSMDAHVLIMDEPTSSLAQKETDCLLQVIRELRQQGVCVVYISHRLREVEEIADRVIGLRDGKNAGELSKDEIKYQAMVKMMVGRDVKLQRRPSTYNDSAIRSPILRVNNLCHSLSKGDGVSLEVRPGEIVGMAGLVGAGRSEFAETLFGIRPKVSGQIYLNGELGQIRCPADAIKLGLALVPEDRRNHGLILAESIGGNIALPNLDTLQIAKILNFGKIRTAALTGVSSLRIRTTGIAKQAGQLSGGNQQKVVLYKWLHRQPRLLILDEPTRGVDVGAKKEIYDLMHDLTEKGVGILMISSDLEEIINLSDRVIIMHENQKTGELSRDQLSEESIMRLATGANS